MIIKNCIFTKQDTTVLKLWEITSTYIHTGVDIAGLKIYSPCYGVVASHLYNLKEKYVVVIQYNKYTCIRISNLKSTVVKLGDLVTDTDTIGVCDKYAHIEYLLSEVSDTPALCVRVGTYTYYKYNPMELVKGDISFPLSGASSLTIVTPTTELPSMPQNISNEFGDNK